MSTALYRKTGGEVLKISLPGQSFNVWSSTYYGVLTDPSLPDGTTTLNGAGVARQLGFAKFANVAGNIVRNATQAEIDAWQAAEDADVAAMDAERVVELIDTDPQFRRYGKALLKLLIQEFIDGTNVKVNTLISAQWNQFKIEVAAASNLADLKTRIATLPAIAADLRASLTVSAAVTALKGKVSASD